ncbi:hypothetical protein Taro_003731 [Colocasia esculenta]|uniref:Aminotransferase-like plant mobile domain-containing protein n=1 Tax=Colocasia esculenta TaxID=4460 RepID=A0A843TSQ6_COLES|nr:hypothetical protein [Colocasia esculenta]
MRARVSWLLVLAVYLAFPAFQRERLEGMGFGEVLRMDRMRADPTLTQTLCSRWDAEATAFVFPWGHMIPSLEDVSRITGLRVYGRPVSGFTYPCYWDLARRLLGLIVGQRSSLLSRVELQESLGLYKVGKKVGETVDGQLQRLTQGCRAVLAEEPGVEADHDLQCFLILFLGGLLLATRGDAVHFQFLPLLEDLDEVGDYAWGAAFLAHQFDSLGNFERQTSTSGFFPFLQVWAYLHLPVLRRGILERPGLVPIARHWDSRRDMHTLSDQLASLQDAIDSYPQLDSTVEFPSRDRTPRPGRSFQGLHDTTDWRERAKEHKARSDFGVLEMKFQVDVAGETASLRALLYSAMQDREIAQREAKQLERELRIASDRASQLQGQVDAATGERDRLRIQAEAAELLVAETTRELATLRVQGSSVDQTDMARLRTEVTAQ